MARYQAPAGADGINIGGQQFNADAQGIITVPDEGDYTMPEDYARITELAAAPAVAQPQSGRREQPEPAPGVAAE